MGGNIGEPGFNLLTTLGKPISSSRSKMRKSFMISDKCLLVLDKVASGVKLSYTGNQICLMGDYDVLSAF